MYLIESQFVYVFFFSFSTNLASIGIYYAFFETSLV